MANLYVVNAFSLNMLGSFNGVRTVLVGKISEKDAKELYESNQYIPAIGHQDIAKIAQNMLGSPKSLFDRKNVTLKNGDACLVAQYVGPRLPEGTTSLPEGAKIEWMNVTIE